MIECFKSVVMFFCLFEIINILYKLVIDDKDGWEAGFFQIFGYIVGGAFLYFLIHLIRNF